jgi:SAM-dependent methyltransferase
MSKAVLLLRRSAVIIQQFFALRSAPNQRFRLVWKDRWLLLRDATSTTAFDRHYVFHTAWASRILAEHRPRVHIDISSSLFFVVNASAFVPIKFYDYRPVNLGLSNLTSEPADLHRLPFATQSAESVSCLHVLEHVGLGRYGEPLDYDGDLKAVAELKRVIAKGGLLIIAVPIGGVARIQFNAHRIYTYRQVLEMFSGLSLLEFSLIPNEEINGGLIRNASEEAANKESYGCGCFLFQVQQ